MQPISVACFNKNAWIRIIGRGNFQCSSTLKELVLALIQKGYHDYVLDLINCEQMDSTFMGTITGIAQRLRKQGQGTFKVVNVSKSNQDLMENLGLDHLFLIQSLALGSELAPVTEDLFSSPSALIEQIEDKKKTQEIVLAAHQELVTIDKNNAEKFKDLMELMK
ncbi:MAG: STAS domain-containing protein [Chthoniobacterales bacterium]|nr:STAS domain-containing protein [Chthoniobacterales bacterium]